jgi:uncharacterized protein
MITASHLILYVEDQRASAAFYSAVLAQTPSLDVLGMTEFTLGDGCTLGLMPVAGIRRLLGERLPDPTRAAGFPRAELYLRVDDPAEYHRRTLANGARELSSLLERDWGDVVAYSLDPDGHVLAFAAPSGTQHLEQGSRIVMSVEELAAAVREAAIEAALLAHEDAGLRGLCHEGRWEYALQAVRELDLAAVLSQRSPPSAGPAPEAGEAQ